MRRSHRLLLCSREPGNIQERGGQAVRLSPPSGIAVGGNYLASIEAKGRRELDFVFPHGFHSPQPVLSLDRTGRRIR
ncbi:MAG: hypothetical protein QHH30_02365 [candidate division NC10 bacterium]|nr:hypothetical protein [candidate division NC10 bacterium]